LLFAVSAPATAQSDFAQAIKPRDWQFPRDHGQHPEYQTEWWYFTGNLRGEDGRRFGYELTFFRQALEPSMHSRPSRWAFRDAYVAHFAITDIENGRFHYDQKTMRGAFGLADANDTALAVHIGNWSARQVDSPVNGEYWEVGNIRLQATSTFGQIDFSLNPAKPPVFHGERGLLPNSALAGDAAYYYCFTSLQTAGTLFLSGDSAAGAAFRVQGSSWMDHEFFTSHPASEVAGWDWLSLRLSDSTEVMLFRFRRADGAHSPYSAGTFIRRDGSSRYLAMRDFDLVPQAYWTSSATSGKYPIAWKIKFFDYDLQLTTPRRIRSWIPARQPA
jgi:predicted secreted hydrolase